MKTKKVYMIILLVVAATVAGLFYKEDYNRNNPETLGPIVLRVAHTVNEETVLHKGLAYFEKEVEEMSNGRLDVQIFSNGVLGGDRQSLEAVSIGSLTATAPPSGILASFEPTFMVADLPFVFASRESAYKALDNELGKVLSKSLERINIECMSFTETGFRYITNNKNPIYTPEDLKGLKIRTMENPMHMESFRLWGANPTPMNFSELFTALQQGTVDGQENPAQVIWSSRFYEVQKYLSLTGHFFSSGSLAFNKTFFDNLPDDLREIIVTCAEDYKHYSRNLIIEMEDEYINVLQGYGMEVNTLTPEQKQVFAESAAPVYDTFRKTYENGDELIRLATMYN